MELLKIEQMILIGSTGRNSGKTTLAIELIRKWKNKFPVIALKITTIKNENVQRVDEAVEFVLM